MYAISTENIIDESIVDDISGSIDIFNAIGERYGFKTMRHLSGRQPIFGEDQKEEEALEITIDDQQMKQKIAQAKENIKIALKSTNMVLQDIRELHV